MENTCALTRNPGMLAILLKVYWHKPMFQQYFLFLGASVPDQF